MLEISFLLPDNFARAHLKEDWGYFSHGTDIRKLLSALNTGVFLASREGEGGVKTVAGAT